MKKQKQTTATATVPEQIARIRRDIFDPGDKKMEQLIQDCGPERALDILQLAARFGRTLETVH